MGGNSTGRGVCGVATWISGKDGRVVACTARLWVKSIILQCHARASLDDAIFDHVLLVQMRDAFHAVLGQECIDSAELSKERVSTLGLALEAAAEKVLRDAGRPASETFSHSVHIHQSFVGRQLHTATTSSIAECFRQRQTVYAARNKSWEAFHQAFIGVMFLEAPRVKWVKRRSPDALADELNAAYEKYAPERDAKRKGKEDKARQGASQLSRALAAHEAGVRAQRLRTSRERLKWHRRRDLTMAEIMSGPPRC